MRLRIWCVLLVTMTSLVRADGTEVTGVTIDSPGLYEAILARSTGTNRKRPAEFDLVRVTAKVRAARGVLFGFHYTVDGVPPRKTVTIREVYRFPGEGIVRRGERITVDQARVRRRIGEPYFTGFEFEQDGEMVPGPWTIEIWYDDRKLGEQAFTVTR